jgi:hypothetical protein
MTLRTIPGDGVGTIAETEITCDHCGLVGVTVRDVVPEGWLEVRDGGGYHLYHVPFSKHIEDTPRSWWFCRPECAVLFCAGMVTRRARAAVEALHEPH